MTHPFESGNITHIHGNTFDESRLIAGVVQKGPPKWGKGIQVTGFEHDLAPAPAELATHGYVVLSLAVVGLAVLVRGAGRIALRAVSR